MIDRQVKRTAQQFRREYLADQPITYDRLCDITESLGYIIVEFNECENDPEVETLIRVLRFDENLLNARGFTYADAHHRLVFVNEKLGDEEKLVVLAHELGHIELNHLGSRPIFGGDVQQEYSANEFAHYLLHRSFAEKLHALLRRRWAAALCGLLFLAALAYGGIAFVNAPYYGKYYLTASGTKYHNSTCSYVVGKKTVHRMTKAEYASGRYAPCAYCLPNEQSAP